MAAFRTLWTALATLYDNMLPLVGGNLAALLLNLPLGCAVYLASQALAAGEPTTTPDSGSPALALSIAGLLPLLPTPRTVDLASQARAAAASDVPRFADFQPAL